MAKTREAGKRIDVSVGADEARLIAVALEAYWIQSPEHDADVDMRQEQAEFIELTQKRWESIASRWTPQRRP